MSYDSNLQVVLDNLDKAITDMDKYGKFIQFLTFSDKAPTYCQILVHTLKHLGEEKFCELARSIADDALKTLDDATYAKIMFDIYKNYLEPSNKTLIDNSANLKLILANPTATMSVVEFNLLNMLSKIPPKSLDVFVTHVINISKQINSQFGTLVELKATECATLLKTGTGKLVSIGLVAAFLTYEAYNALKRWWNGEISGKRCLKNVLDATVSAGCGIAASMAAGCTIGAVAGPAGAVIGGIVGSIFGSEVARILSDWLMCKIFNIPKDEATENAYDFLGLKQTASNEEINKKFKNLCLKYHPDKGGKAEDFHKLQVSMSLIRFSRGEF